VFASTDWMLSAQAQAIAAQGLPPLKKFSSENLEMDDDSFERQLELFPEKGQISRWADEHKLYDLKIHMEGNTLQSLHIVLDKEKNKYDLVFKRLRKWLRSVNIEELRSVEFLSKDSKF